MYSLYMFNGHPSAFRVMQKDRNFGMALGQLAVSFHRSGGTTPDPIRSGQKELVRYVGSFHDDHDVNVSVPARHALIMVRNRNLHHLVGMTGDDLMIYVRAMSSLEFLPRKFNQAASRIIPITFNKDRETHWEVYLSKGETAILQTPSCPLHETPRYT